MKLYFSPREVAILIDSRYPPTLETWGANGVKRVSPHPSAGQLDVRSVRRWLHKAGALIKKAGGHPKQGSVLLPASKMREIWPDMWERYCEENAEWDEPGCSHEYTRHYDWGMWCVDCGGLRVDGDGWRLRGHHEPA